MSRFAGDSRSLFFSDNMSKEDARKELVTYQSKIKTESTGNAVISRIPRPLHNLPRVNRVEGKAIKGTVSEVQQSDVTMRSVAPVLRIMPKQNAHGHEECKQDAALAIDWSMDGSVSAEDVDVFDLGDPQLCAEYVQDIYKYLRYLENQPRMVTGKDFLQGQLPQMPRYRSILVDWIVGICSHFHLLQETLFLSVDLLDRYMQNCFVNKRQLQLVGITCLYIASKYEEIYPPYITDFIRMTDSTYSKEELLQMEKMLLASLRYELGKPLPVHFLRRFSKLADADTREHNLAKYILECALHIAAASSALPSLKAAGALCLSRSLLHSNGTVWPYNVAKHSGYTIVHINPVMDTLKSSIKAVHFRSGNCKHANYTYKKYQRDKFMRVGTLVELEVLNKAPHRA